MLAKLRLDQTGTFEKLVGAHYISEMLVSFVQGHIHPIEIGAEQGGIEKWDDFVIQENPKLRTHIQIKRQTDRFGSELDECERNEITRHRGNVELRDLSELDKTIKSLGNWIKTKKDSDEYERKFRLELYDGGVEIKKGFKVRELINILEVHFKPDVSTPEGLQSLSDNDASMKQCERWLRSWCGINDFEQILNLLKVLSIKYTNTESDLKDKTKSTLKNIFKTSSIDEVHTKIIAYTFDNSAFTGAIRPRHLLFILKNHLLPEVKRWTQFQTGGLNWNISGINDLEYNNKIERPAVIVPAFWSTDNLNARSLKIDGACGINCLVSESLMRLSLHHQGLFDILCSDKSSWVQSIKNKTGGTLGIAKNDLNDSRILDSSEPSSSIELRELTTIDEQEAEAKKLHNKMYNVTFKLVNTDITAAIHGMNSGDLRTNVESRWSLWKETLESDVEEQRKLFSKMLHPKAEGESISGELRVGLKTV